MTGSDDTVLECVRSNDTLLDDVSPLLRPAGQSSPARAAPRGEFFHHYKETLNETRNLYRLGGSDECWLCLC